MSYDPEDFAVDLLAEAAEDDTEGTLHVWQRGRIMVAVAVGEQTGQGLRDILEECAAQAYASVGMAGEVGDA